MKSSSKSLVMVSVVFVVSAGGCALIGYDLHDYVLAADAGVGDAGKGGGGGAAGSGGGPSSASESASSSTSGDFGCPNECDDNNACTVDKCVGGHCKHILLPLDDGNACTEDTCDKVTGDSHKLIAGCCAHSACFAGNGPLDQASCNPMNHMSSCVATVCALNMACCNTRWDESCVKLAQGKCTVTINDVLHSISCKCAHSYCDAGEALDPACDPCVFEICQQDPSCCNGKWSETCVSYTINVCGIPGGQCQ